MPNTASASVLPFTCAMPQSSRVIVTLAASAFHAARSASVCAWAGVTKDRAKRDSATTQRGYRADVIRDLGWLRIQRGKPLASKSHWGDTPSAGDQGFLPTTLPFSHTHIGVPRARTIVSLLGLRPQCCSLASQGAAGPADRRLSR